MGGIAAGKLDDYGMKIRTAKKRIHRYVRLFAKHKIPKAFKTGRERRAWVKEISDWHIKRLKVKEEQA